MNNRKKEEAKSTTTTITITTTTIITSTIKVKVLVTKSCLTLFDPMGYSLPGSSVHGFLQAKILQWVAMPSSRGSSGPKDQTSISYTGRRILYH